MVDNVEVVDFMALGVGSDVVLMCEIDRLTDWPDAQGFCQCDKGGSIANALCSQEGERLGVVGHPVENLGLLLTLTV